METAAHRKLKQLAVAFLREHGCPAVALEVRCPIRRYRVDVAGYTDTIGLERPFLGEGGAIAPNGSTAGNGRRRRRRPPRTVLIECKQSRADFLRDRRDTNRLLTLRADLDRFRRSLEEKRIRIEEPHLRRAGTALFTELEEWDFAASRLPAYRQVLRRLRRLDRMLHGETKFCMAARYALADRLYIAAPRGLIQRRELPPGWGLLECPKAALHDDDPNADLFGRSRLEVTVRPPILAPREEYRQRLLRNIAVAASSAASSALGVLA
ncbi:MAG: hypothetical protein SYC29_10785 [Planctomycetota bacterium]|nr:hypothetical protein [Planctomycetota bacterium]